MMTPDEDCIARGAKLISHLKYENSECVGQVYDESGEVHWRHSIRKNNLKRSCGNPFKTPDFVAKNLDTAEELIFRRESFLPSRYLIKRDEALIGSVSLESVLRNKYQITLHGQSPWALSMPLFSTLFWGGTNESPEFWVRVGPSKTQWNILVKPGIETQTLIAALSFIHYQWWNYA